MTTGKTAVLGVDVQGAFLPKGGNRPADGALAVADGHEVIGPLLAAAAAEHVDYVVLSKDDHPPGHDSFVEQGGIWPRHAETGTFEAEIVPELLELSDFTVFKGTGLNEPDQYSAFEGAHPETGETLTQWLRRHGVTKLLIGGLATDYCVKASVLHALQEGFEVEVLTDAVRAVNVNAGDDVRALEEMVAAGATLDRPLVEA